LLPAFWPSLPSRAFEAQAVERAETLVAFVEAPEIEFYRSKASARGLVEDRGHLRRQVGGRGFLVLLRGIVEFPGVVDRRQFLDRGIARGDVAILGGRWSGEGRCHGCDQQNRREKS